MRCKGEPLGTASSPTLGRLIIWLCFSNGIDNPQYDNNQSSPGLEHKTGLSACAARLRVANYQSAPMAIGSSGSAQCAQKIADFAVIKVDSGLYCTQPMQGLYGSRLVEPTTSIRQVTQWHWSYRASRSNTGHAEGSLTAQRP